MYNLELTEEELNSCIENSFIANEYGELRLNNDFLLKKVLKEYWNILSEELQQYILKIMSEISETRFNDNKYILFGGGKNKHGFYNDIPETVKIQLLQFNGWNIVWFDIPSEQLQLIAVKMSLWPLQLIKNPTENVIIQTILLHPEILDLDENVIEYGQTLSDPLFDFDYFIEGKFSKNIQAGILKERPDLIGKIKNLAPELKEKYKTSLNGAETGFY